MGRVLVIVGLIFTLLRVAMKGYISEFMAAFILVIAIFLASLPKKTGIFLTLFATLFSIYFLMKDYKVGFQSLLTLLVSLLPLLIILYGLYLMFHSLFRENHKKKDKTKSIFPF